MAIAEAPLVLIIDDEPQVRARVASRLRPLPATAAIVLITGSDATAHETLSRGLGAVAHLPKPFTATQLLRAVGQALGIPSG